MARKLSYAELQTSLEWARKSEAVQSCLLNCLANGDEPAATETVRGQFGVYKLKLWRADSASGGIVSTTYSSGRNGRATMRVEYLEDLALHHRGYCPSPTDAESNGIRDAVFALESARNRIVFASRHAA